MTPASHVLRWIFALSAVGYAIVALMALSVGAESRPLAVGLRVLVVLISGAAVLMFAKGSISTRPPVALLAFLLLYLGRLIWDLQLSEETQVSLQFYLIVVIIPTLAVMMLSIYWEDFNSARLFLIIGMCGSLLVILASVFGFSEWRSTTVNSGGRFSYDTLDPITVGNLGAATVIAGFCVYRVTRAPWVLAGLALGFSCLIMGLSRGPILSLLGCGAVYMFLTGRIWLLISVSLITSVFLFTEFGEDVLNILRLGDFQNDQSSSIRINILISSINQFIRSPLIGSGHFDPISGSYPHNLFVDSAISMGIVGIALVVFLFVRAWQVGSRRARSGELFVFLTLVYWMIEVQFSGAIWSNVMLWLSMAIVLSSRRVVEIPEAHRLFKGAKPRLSQLGALNL